MATKNVKDFQVTNQIDLSTDSILSIQNNELKRLNGNNSSIQLGSGIFNSGINLNNSKLINAVPEFIVETTNFLISGNDNSRMVFASASSTITGTIVSGNVIGFNTSIIQVNSGQIQITGLGNGIIINSFNNQFKTAGGFATISLLHTGNNRYIMYGNTSR